MRTSPFASDPIIFLELFAFCLKLERLVFKSNISKYFTDSIDNNFDLSK